MPEVRGTADVDGGAYLPFLPLPRMPSRQSSFRSSDGRTGTNRTCDSTRTLFAHHFKCRLWRWGWCTSWAPYDHLIRPQRELLPTRLVTHRTDLSQHNVGNAEGCIRGQASVLLSPANISCG